MEAYLLSVREQGRLRWRRDAHFAISSDKVCGKVQSGSLDVVGCQSEQDSAGREEGESSSLAVIVDFRPKVLHTQRRLLSERFERKKGIAGPTRRSLGQIGTA